MSHSERRLAMLREMGIRVWQPKPAAPAEAPPPQARPLAAAQAPTAEASTARHPIAAAEPGAADRMPISAPAQTPTDPTPDSAPREPNAAPAPAAAEVAALDWPTLRAAVTECQACTLCATRTQTVFGVGHRQAHWMVVGEAPGEQEDAQGEPFVGVSGQLLDNMLRALGLSRAEDEPGRGPEHCVYIANTLKCRPPRNRNPTPQELALCAPFLKRQVALLQPKIILAMGRFAVHSLLDSNEPIGQLRGRVHRYEGVPLVVTYHPAYLLRNLADKARAWDDLCLAALTAERAPTG